MKLRINENKFAQKNKGHRGHIAYLSNNIQQKFKGIKQKIYSHLCIEYILIYKHF